MRNIAVTLFLLHMALPTVWAGSNLVLNGSFDDPEDPLKGWLYKYEMDGDGKYRDEHNEQMISIVAQEQGQRSVLCMTPTGMVSGFQGVKVDSKPIPVDLKNKRYRFSLKARSDAMDGRFLLEGYQWRPGIKPHADPTIYELRKCYKFELLFADPAQGGAFSGVKKTWSTYSMEIPGRVRSELQQEMLSKVKFVIVHLIALSPKYINDPLYIDDVRLEEISK